MYAALLLVFLTFAASGAAFLWLAHASKNRRLPPNQLAGIRTRTTLHSDEAWYVAQESTAFHIQVSGYSLLVTAITSLGLMVAPLNDDQISIAFTLLSLAACIWVLAWVITGSIKGNKAARAVIETAEEQAT